MCDRHKGKRLDHFCLEHETIVCSQCASEEHAQTPCESMPLTKASKHIALKIEHGMAELKKLKGITQSILDGTREDDVMQTVNEVETIIDNYIEELKRKLKKCKTSLKPFSELSQEERWKLKAVATKKIQEGPPLSERPDFDESRDMVTKLQEVRKQQKIAQDALNALPNYVEVSANKEFLKSLTYDGYPLVIKRNGQTDVSDEEDLNETVSSQTCHQETVYLIEKTSFSLEHCTDIVMMSDYAIAAVGDSVQKRDRIQISFREAIAVHGASHLCVIGETTEVSVMQKHGQITVLETTPSFKLLYTLFLNNVYIDISYLESIQGVRGCPEYSPVFVVCYSTRETHTTECVDLIKPAPTKFPRNPLSFTIQSDTIADSSFGRNRSRFRGITSVSAFQNKNILVAATRGVTCLDKAGNLIWTIDLRKGITDIVSYKTLIFVSIKGERRIMTIGKQGHVIEENILPPMDLFPQKLKAHEDTLMVKHFGQYKWVIFKKMYEAFHN